MGTIGDSNAVNLNEKSDRFDTCQLWLKQEEDSEGWFKLRIKKSKQLLTVSNDKGLVIAGMYIPVFTCSFNNVFMTSIKQNHETTIL